jgi:lysine 2,3-aminomutase
MTGTFDKAAPGPDALTGPRITGTLRSLDDLLEAGLLAAVSPALEAVAQRYAIAVTPDMAALIDRADPHDPIGRQFVPDARELDQKPHESADPIGDARHEKVPGLVHRYRDRVLIKLTHACPVYCRFCFRREMVGPGGETALSEDKLAAAVAYVAADPQIFEVILTGGDPLILSPRRIGDVTRRLSAISHVQVLRWHTRVPVVDPARVTAELVSALTGAATGKAVFVAIHANHPREFTPAAQAAIARLADAGIGLVSQSVLLRGLNDAPEVMAALMRTFLANRVKPYYLHHADLAPGTGHFRTTIAEGQALMRALRGSLSGLAQPTYVVDIPGGVAKVPVGPGHLDDGGAALIDPGGNRHAYPERG